VLLKKKLSVLWAAAIMVLAVLLASGAALAITGGTPDVKDPITGQFKYPYVGALVDEDGVYCSGTLVPSNTGQPVFLTAAHCYPWVEGDPSYVTFEPKYEAEGKNFADPSVGLVEYSGTFHEHPSLDIAVVKFDQNDPDYSQLLSITPAQLPTEGLLAGTAKGAKFTPVGYGDTSGYSYDAGTRRYAPYTTFKSLNRTYLSTSQHRGSGGTCYGDSGGPNFFGPAEENRKVIAGITITGDTWCKATNVTLRLDTKPVHTFLTEQGVTVP
jgi:secreted trypsin-like serine protease